MTLLPRTLIVSALIAAHGLAAAGPRHYDPPRHHHHHHRLGLGGALLGLAIAVPLIAIASHADRSPDVVYVPPPAPLPPPPAPVVVYQQSSPPGRAEPIIYPRNGQSPEQLEFDRRECNRWATTQQEAMRDASVFNRAVDACMDGRGYTLK